MKFILQSISGTQHMKGFQNPLLLIPIRGGGKLPEHCVFDFFCASILRRPFLMALINASLSITEDTGIFLSRASSVNSVLVLLDNSEVRFMKLVPGEKNYFLQGPGRMQTGSSRIMESGVLQWFYR